MQFWPKYFIKKIINNQAPVDPNMSAYDHVTHVCALSSKHSRCGHIIYNICDYNNYVFRVNL